MEFSIIWQYMCISAATLSPPSPCTLVLSLLGLCSTYTFDDAANKCENEDSIHEDTGIECLSNKKINLNGIGEWAWSQKKCCVLS